MQFNVGDSVKWVAWSNGQKVTKCGHIWAVVPARVNPRTFVPSNMFFSSKSEFRDKVSYLIKIPRIAILYYPEMLWPMEAKEEVNIYTQDVPLSLSSSAEVVDSSDREKLKFVFELAGNRFIERKAFLVNVSTQTRYWFWVEDGVEYVKSVERFELKN